MSDGCGFAKQVIFALVGSLVVLSAGLMFVPAQPSRVPLPPTQLVSWASRCPSNPLRGVYNADRLEVLGECLWYRGNVTTIRQKANGDYRVNVRPEKGYRDFLNSVNSSKQDGALVTQIMKGQRLAVPKKGEHIAVFGTWVNSTQHGWNEIHPIWGIRYLDRGFKRWDLPLPTSPSSTGPGCTGVEVAAGESIQAAIDNNPPGTTFCIRAFHALGATLVPKPGDVFQGDPTATLDGGGTTAYAFTGNENGIDRVQIRSLVVEHFNPADGRAALDLSPGAGWIIKNNEVAYNSTEGIEVYSGGVVSGNNVHDNGQLGIFGYQAADARVTGNEVWRNNTAGYDQSVEAGGMKFSKTTNILIRGNNVHHNWGTGIWLDTADSGYLIDSNTVTGNSHHGISIEADYSGTVRDNVVANNGFLQPSPYGGSGIHVDRSATVTVVENTVSCSQQDNYHYVNEPTVVDGGGNQSLVC